MSLQNDLANYSFLSLLGSMILYWASTLFGEELSSAPHRFAPVSEGLQNPTVPSKALKNRSSFASVFKKSQIWKKEVLLKRQKRSALSKTEGCQKKTTLLLPFEGNASAHQKPHFALQAHQKPKEEAGLGKTYSPQNWFAIQNLARYGIIVSNILLGLLLILRWKESGHFPLSNLYESLMFLSWCFTGLYLFIDLGSDLRDASSASLLLQKPTFAEGQKDKNEKIDRFSRLSLSKNTRQLLGAITTPSALLTNAFATFTLPKEMQEATPLVPALQSNWLMMHVTVMVLSYAALILGSLLSIAFLIVTAFAGGKESEGKEAKLKEYQNTTALLQKPLVSPALQAHQKPVLSSQKALLFDKQSFFEPEVFDGPDGFKKPEEAVFCDSVITKNGVTSSQKLPFGREGVQPVYQKRPVDLTFLPFEKMSIFDFVKNVKFNFLRNSSFDKVKNGETVFGRSELPVLFFEEKEKTSFFGRSEARFFAFSPLRSAPLVQAYDFPKLTVLLNIASVQKTLGFLKACLWQGEDIQQKQKQLAFSVQAAGALSPRPFRDAEGTEGLRLHQRREAQSEQNIRLNSAFNSNISPRLKKRSASSLNSLLAITLDNLSYRILGIGFPLLTIGILSGAVWANEAWGSYWSWDPKETWALLTWLIFAIYLHTRLSKGWEGKKPAIIASLGFVIVWICYLGVNLIGEGLHSYGWISST